MKKQNIVFIGFRGCGKTTFGRALSRIAGLPFADIDEEIEFILGEPVKKFIAKHGFQVFREVEQRVTHDFCRNFSGVIATGAGTIENSKNFQNLKKTGVFVFANPRFSDVKSYLLSLPPDSHQRMNKDISLSAEIDQMWAQRKGIYSASAEIEIEPDMKADAESEIKRLLPVFSKILPPAPEKKKIALFSSSNGTTFQGLLDAQKRGRIPNVDISLFVTDQPKCKALEKAKKAKIKTLEVLPAPANTTREEYDRSLINVLRANNPDYVLLAGWMRILSPLYCDQFGSITLNAHPSLLPKFSGLKDVEVHQQVLEQEERYTGATIHRVSAVLDAGETVLQRKVLVDENDTVESLRQKVQKQEILGFCEVLEKR